MLIVNHNNPSSAKFRINNILSFDFSPMCLKLKLKKRGRSPISYFASLISAVLSFVAVPTFVESNTVESVVTAVESVVSFEVDFEPHAANVTDTITANTNIYFFILM